MSLVYIWFSTIVTILQYKVLSLSPLMKATLKYLAGIAGPSGYGSKTTAEQVAEDCLSSMPTSHQLTAIVTGATSGIGAETARVLAKRGVRIVIPARDLRKAEKVKENIEKESPEAEIIILEIDLSSFASIQRFCSEFLSLGLPLHILINNAGKYSQKLEFSEDKIELTFATNYLGHFLLTEMLLGKMVETASESCIEGRIVNVSSVVHNWVKSNKFCFSKLLSPKRYNGTHAYAQSKLANILHAKELARQLKLKDSQPLFAMPLSQTTEEKLPFTLEIHISEGYKMTITITLLFGILTYDLFRCLQAAATTCYVALSPRTVGLSGKYFADCNESHCSALASQETEARKLWKQTRALIHRRLLLPVGQNIEGSAPN